MKLMVAFAMGGGWGSRDPAIPVLREEGRRLLESHPTPTWWEPGWERGIHHAILAAFLPVGDRTRGDFAVAIEEFERAGDQASLAEVLSDTADMWGHADNAWVLDCLRRSIKIYESIEVADLGQAHARQQLGQLLVKAGEHAEAAEQFRRAASIFEGTADLNCWALSVRLRALSAVRADARPTAAAGWLLDVIDIRAELTMPEMHTPELLDVAAFVLARGGDSTRAAQVFGRAEAVPLPIDPDVYRTPIHIDIRTTIAAEISHDQYDQQRNLGEKLSIDDAFALAVEALTELAASGR
jgi:tetratricopeptide (TPR) repeat protein